MNEALVKHVRGAALPAVGSEGEQWWLEAMRLAGHHDMIEAHQRYVEALRTWQNAERVCPCEGDDLCERCHGTGRLNPGRPPRAADYYPKGNGA